MVLAGEFEKRKENAKKVRERMIRILEDYGLLVSHYGVEDTLTDEVNETIKGVLYRRDLTAKFVRFSPDTAVVLREKKRVFLCESKATLGEYPNYSYELDSYEIGKKLARAGVDLFVVFDAEKAAWAGDIDVHTIKVPKQRWSKEYADTIADHYPNKKIDYE
ncbi:hypothetical protein AKJ38_02375, partial [candidate division MSBL1 archaeon SCGC-AAA259I14]